MTSPSKDEHREYQQQTLDQTRALIAQGERRILIWLATGAGKTKIFCDILKGAYAKGKTALIVVKGIGLVAQAHQRLLRENVPHGVHQGKHWNYNPFAPIQVCSIDTLSRRKITPPADIIVIDETHLSNTKSYKWLRESYQNAVFLNFTATPFNKTGMRFCADEVVHPITHQELIDKGYLSQGEYYVPTKVDLRGVRIDAKTGDYQVSDLTERVSGATYYGDLIKNYRAKLDGKAALCFAVTVAHSQHIAGEFNMAGIPAAHVDADTPQTEREALFEKLENGELRVLTSQGVLTTGVDIPCLGGLIFARPTKSLNLWHQMLGRGTRRYKNKKKFIILDHANNFEEHGPIEDEPPFDLDGKKKRESTRKPTICEACFFAWFRMPTDKVCPACGEPFKITEKVAIRKTDNDKDAILIEVSKKKNLSFLDFVDQKCQQAINQGRKPGWVFGQIARKYGESEAKGSWTYVKTRVLSQSMSNLSEI